MNLITIMIDADREVVVPRRLSKCRTMWDAIHNEVIKWGHTGSARLPEAVWDAAIAAAPKRQQAAMDENSLIGDASFERDVSQHVVTPEITHQNAISSVFELIDCADARFDMRSSRAASQLQKYIRQQAARASLGHELTGAGE